MKNRWIHEISIAKQRMRHAWSKKIISDLGNKTNLFSSSARDSSRGRSSPRYRYDPFRIRCKHVRPRSRLIFNKIWKAEKFAFSRPSALDVAIPRETLGRWSSGHAITIFVRSTRSPIQSEQLCIFCKMKKKTSFLQWSNIYIWKV